MNPEIKKYNLSQSKNNAAICALLGKEIMKGLPKAENKIWHRSPVWFLDGNPVAGYNVQKKGVQLIFWSGYSFGEPNFLPIGNVVKFKAAGMLYTDKKQIVVQDLRRWLRKSKTIQWDYKNIVKRRGKLVRLK